MGKNISSKKGRKLPFVPRDNTASGPYRRAIAREDGRKCEVKARISERELALLTKWRRIRGLTVSQAIRVMLHKSAQFGMATNAD